MKTLLESIFGSKESIVNSATESLWEGYEEAFDNYKYRKDRYMVLFKWVPSNSNNILNIIYHDSYLYLMIGTDINQNYMINIIQNDNNRKFCKAYKIIKRPTGKNIDECIEYLKNAFREHPDMLLNKPEETLSWSEFKKRYKSKK